MLQALLERVSSLFSRYFLIGSFGPVLIFAVINVLLLCWTAGWFRQLAHSGFTEAGLATGAASIAMILIAYLLSAIGTFLRELLEGRHVSLPKSLFLTRQRNNRDVLVAGYRGAWAERRQISGKRSAWQDALSQALDDGTRQHPRTMTYDGTTGPAAAAIEALRTAYKVGESISFQQIDAAVNAALPDWRLNDINHATPNGDQPLRKDHDEILRIIDAAEDDWSKREIEFFNEKGFRFGMGEVSPTAMGNVADSMQSYAYSRYQMNLDTFWSRLQPALQKSTDYYATLLDAKTQLDFLVACCWLAGLTTAAWLGLLVWKGHTVWPFLVVAIAGPLSTRGLYLLAVKSYLVFADLVRTGVDLHRFALLASLNIAPPNGIRQERTLWSALERWTSYGQDLDLSYKISDRSDGS